MPQSQSPQISSPRLQPCKKPTLSVYDFPLLGEGPILSMRCRILCPKFMKRHGLSLNSPPQEWFRTFFTNCQGQIGKGEIFINNWYTYTIVNDMLVNAGTIAGPTYPTFPPFTPRIL